MRAFLLAAVVLVLLPPSLAAAPITFEVEYITTGSRTCFFTQGVCFPVPLDPFTLTFTLEPSQLMIDGLYDVAASLDPIPIPPLPPRPSEGTPVTNLLVAFATVAGEQVIDLVIDFDEKIEESCVGFPTTTTSSFTAATGFWGSGTIASGWSGACDPYSKSFNGTYTVQQLPGEVPVAVPEPTTLLLLGSGMIGAAWKRRRRCG